MPLLELPMVVDALLMFAMDTLSSDQELAPNKSTHSIFKTC